MKLRNSYKNPTSICAGVHANTAELIWFSLAYIKGEHNSKVVAHIGDEDFTVRISTDGEEYNIEVCFTVESSIQTVISFPCGCFSL